MGTYFEPRPPPSDYWYVSFSFLVDPGPLHEIAASAFSRSQLESADTSSFPCFPSTLDISPSSSALPLYLLALAFPFSIIFFLLISCAQQPSQETVPLLGLPPKSFHKISRDYSTLSHVIPARPIYCPTVWGVNIGVFFVAFARSYTRE